MQNGLGIRGRGEYGPLLLQGALNGKRVGQIAIMGHRKAAIGELGEKGLDITQPGAASGGVARVADRTVPGQAVKHRLFGEGEIGRASCRERVRSRVEGVTTRV